MAQNFELLLCVSLLLLLLIPLQSYSENPTTQKLSSFHSLKKFQGSKKGENRVGLHELKQYLNKFGYLQNDHFSKVNDDNFDDSLEAAIKIYQANYNLKITGTLNSETLSKMMVPRCGVPDVINGTYNSMRRRHGHKGHHRHHPKSLHTVAHYTLFDGRPKWPADKTDLTYAFDDSVTEDYAPYFVESFDKWASFTQQYFTFSETSDYENADIKVGFRRGDHGDGDSFDVPDGVLAHAFLPTDGRLHFNVDFPWSIGAVPNYYDIMSVAVHEIGHLLGLGHSALEDAIMYPSIPSGVSKELQDDDLQGIMDLYNI